MEKFVDYLITFMLLSLLFAFWAVLMVFIGHTLLEVFQYVGYNFRSYYFMYDRNSNYCCNILVVNFISIIFKLYFIGD